MLDYCGVSFEHPSDLKRLNGNVLQKMQSFQPSVFSMTLAWPLCVFALQPLLKVIELYSCEESMTSSQTTFYEIFQKGTLDTGACVIR